MPFFAKSKLPTPVLGQIWTLADSVNNGFLTAPTFSVALRLIGHAQRGETPSEALIQKPGPPPMLEGIQLPQMPPGASPMSPQRTGSVSAPPVEIRPEDRARYSRIFASSGPAGGLLDGEKAKDIFVKSKLPFDKLGAIWNLADTKSRGSLDLADFIVGMHYIQATMNGSLQNIPATLPPGVYEAAAGASALSGLGGAPQSPLRAQATGTSQAAWGTTPLSPTPTGQRGMAGGAAGAASNIMSPQRTGTTNMPSGGAVAWAVTAAEKATSDQFFDGLDTERSGELSGQAVVPFFMQSKLSEAVLANIWDLSDVTQSGSLTRDEFAVAMHLINGALTGTDVPQELPANLVPPSLRGQKLPQAVDPQQTDTQKDLFSLMDDDDIGASQLPVSTATAFANPVAGAPIAGGAPSAAPPTTGQSRNADPSPFEDDFFGAPDTSKVASPAPTPAGAPANRAATAQMPGDQSAEYGNKSLQLNSTQKAVDELQTKRQGLESGVAQSASTLAEIESRLATVRSSHETEARLVKDLESRRDKQSAELKTLRDQLISEESELSRLKAERDEIEQQVMHDREDIRTTKKRMGEVQTELNALKAEVEKLRKDGRQQKGMVAIAKKQLSTAEAEQAKLGEERTALTEGSQTADSGAEGAASREAAGAPAPHSGVPGGASALASPAAASPAISTRSLNPFDRFKATSPQPTGSPAGSTNFGGSTAAGLAGGVAAATAGVGAMHMASQEAGQRESDDLSTNVDNAPRASTPFAPQSDQQQQQQQVPSSTAFDDAFGDDFAPSQPTQTQSPSAPADAAFDDEFDGFGVSAPAAAAPATTAAETPEAPAPTANEVAIDADTFGDRDTAAAVPTADKGKAPVRDDPDADALGADSGASSDGEDEGPEDLSGYRHGAGGGAVGGDVQEDLPSGGITTGLPAAATTAQAQDRFPELPEDDEAGLASTNNRAFGEPTPGAMGNFGSVTPSGIPPSQSATGSAFMSSQTTGNSDAFVDASDDAITAPGATDSSKDVSGSTLGDQGMPGGFDTGMLGTGAAPAAPTPTTTDTDARLSPSSSVKTRRAPPPAPARAGGGAQPAVPAPTAGAPAQTSFDDFEASFADMGSGTSQAPPSANAGASGGFDDAFDDADFDFVPSFAQSGATGAGNNPSANTTSSKVPGPPSSAQQDDGFGGFDDAFGSAGQPPQQSSTATSGAGSNQAATSSDPNSAFSSFEDAFAPSDAADNATAAAPTTAAPPPALPDRSGGGGGGANLAPPPASSTPSAASPALPDDAAPVRQLAGMGFPRHKVIAALEKSNYRVEKALERLLADV